MVRLQTPPGAIFLTGESVMSGKVPTKRLALPAAIETDNLILGEGSLDRHGGVRIATGSGAGLPSPASASWTVEIRVPS